MTRESADEISQIFLSATAKDCKTYRESVRDVLQDNLATAKIFLQEDWAEGGRFVVDVCKERVETCDAYFGLFGFRYGWVPPGFAHSITELEFRWAIDRWKDREPPIFVLLPEKGSDAERRLREEAEKLHAAEPTATADSDRAVQRRFLDSVNAWAGAGGRILVFYRNEIQLITKALSSVHNWNQTLLRRARTARRTALGTIPDG